ncbi:MAG TPA: hypothetical protein DCS93_13785 [Microscillaceae bacterium]|nr:hypothetical protein [Microscillaceae bacterium]
MIELQKNFTFPEDGLDAAEAPNIEMLWVPPSGVFEMGVGKTDKEKFDTTISHGFWLSKYPVTHSHWHALSQFMNHDNILSEVHKNYPYLQSWESIVRLCLHLNIKMEAVLPEGYHFSLVKETQWEYAHNASDGEQALNALPKEEDARLGYPDYYRSWEVGQEEPNPWGFYDIRGYRMEWCFDVFQEYPDSYNYPHLCNEAGVFEDWCANNILKAYLMDAYDFDVEAIDAYNAQKLDEVLTHHFTLRTGKWGGETSGRIYRHYREPAMFRICLRKIEPFDRSDLAVILPKKRRYLSFKEELPWQYNNSTDSSPDDAAMNNLVPHQEVADNSDYNTKILQLLQSDDPANVELAFQLCVAHNGVYNSEVALYLQFHVLLCLRYGLELDYCSTITELNLEEKGLKSLPPEFVQLQALEELSLWNNHFASLPPELSKLKALKSLNLEGNLFGSLPIEIVELQTLEGLSLAANGLINLSPEIGKLQNLVALILESNALTSIPPELGQLQNLFDLNLDTNRLTSLPPELGQLPNLALLDVRNNQLSDLPAELGQLQALTHLVLSNNQLQDLPPELGQLQALEELIIGDNSLTSLPPELGQLQSLDALYAENNQLTSLPLELGQLQNLFELHLSNNQLTNLPAELGQLPLLKVLDVKNNQLTSLPQELGQLQNLQELHLQGNPLPPSEVEALRAKLPECTINF